MADSRLKSVLLVLVVLASHHHACDAVCTQYGARTAEDIAGLIEDDRDVKNVALGRPATQSSTFVGHGIAATADLAVDGNDSPGVRSWWQVDLGVRHNVTSVTITNRGDCCGERLHDFDVDMYNLDPLNSTAAVGTRCHHYPGVMPQGATVKLECNNAQIKGRFVRITNSFNILQLCEVAVMAVVGL